MHLNPNFGSVHYNVSSLYESTLKKAQETNEKIHTVGLLVCSWMVGLPKFASG
jgi:hypothetical protein